MRLPYYKMYPQDFDCDEAVRMLSLSGLGIYVKLLNYAWVNDGLPSDPHDIAKGIGVRYRDFEPSWRQLAANWRQYGDARWRNTRQVEEILQVSKKSLSAKESAKVRWEKHANASETHPERNANAMLSYSESYSEVKNICSPTGLRVSVPPPKSPLPIRVKPLKADEEPSGFAEFWDLRWRTDDRKTAVRAFRKAASSVSRLHQIMAGAKRDRELYLTREAQYRPMMATWLNKERFLDAPEDIASRGPQSELLKWAEEEDLKGEL